jgi:hypothetical protein
VQEMAYLQLDLVMRRMPSTQSSMNVKLRVCLPSPHISNSLSEVRACAAVKATAHLTQVLSS